VLIYGTALCQIKFTLIQNDMKVQLRCPDLSNETQLTQLCFFVIFLRISRLIVRLKKTWMFQE